MNWDAIEAKFQEVWADPLSGDVADHLPTLKRFAAGRRVIEFGVWDCTTTWALLAGRPVWMRSYDNHRRAEVDEVERIAGDEVWRFVYESTLTADIEAADVLYIDTMHTYAQLKAELDRHAGKISQHILMHDTTTFGDIDQLGEKPGLWQAITEFLCTHLEWRLTEVHMHCNGLAVMSRLTRGT